MSAPSPASPPFPDSAPPLRTDADVLARVEQLIGPATAHRTLWVFLVDGDGRQTRVLQEIEGVPASPSSDLAGTLAGIYRELLPAVATDAGPGAAVLVLEHRGSARGRGALDEQGWAAALVTGFSGGDVPLRGVFASDALGVTRATTCRSGGSRATRRSPSSGPSRSP